ncbi:hypothetical protein AaE_000049 [Aphanomyces astaci]|uniref:Uncharacterized protein n=1 Tax=Aphanomyces astaci TaxID=112090 RepID=A0A6A5B0S4_APHAT|nr:hypothetical protein AaE_000049 [Aphanomyces astaci]
MTYQPSTTTPHLPQLQVALRQQRRQLRMTQIIQMFRRGPHSHQWSQMNALELAALAIKLERLVYRGLPDNIGLLSDDALEVRMRRVINLILNASKKPNYHPSTPSNSRASVMAA